MQKVQRFSLVLNLEEKEIVENALAAIRKNGFFMSEVYMRRNEILISPYDFAELLARAEKTLQNEMVLYRLRKQAVEKINPNSFEYYLVAGVKIGYKAHAPARVREPIKLLD